MQECGSVWLDGETMPLDEARVPITTHAMHYGTTAFEGVRAYWAGGDLRIFRAGDHLARLQRSCEHYSLKMPYSGAQLADAMTGLLRENGFREDVYIRIFCFVGQYGISLDMAPGPPLHTAICAFTLGDYFDPGGVSACISPWRKLSGVSTPIQAKMAGNYLNSVISTTDAKRRGFDEAILLDAQGRVSEAAAENIFAVRDGSLSTPPADSSPLLGITRDTILAMCGEAGTDAREIPLLPEDLYSADEVFLSGTASEIVPVTRIGDVTISNGRAGPVTGRMRREYRDLVTAGSGRHPEWLTGGHGP